MKTARSPRNVANLSVRCSPTLYQESMSVISKYTDSRSGCSRRDTLMIFVLGHGHVRTSASPMPDVAPVIQTIVLGSSVILRYPSARPCVRPSNVRGSPSVELPQSKRLDTLLAMSGPGTDPTHADEDRLLSAWIERTVGGQVRRIERKARSRPAWDVDVEVDGRLLTLHARQHEARIVMPFRIRDEVAVHDLLETYGLPVPHAYGLCDDPDALVMDRLSGLVDLAGVADEAERDALLEEYLELLARIYAIPLDAVAAAGFTIPNDSASTGLAFLRLMQEGHDRALAGQARDPIEVFLRRWLAEHVPDDRLADARFITYDAFQFMFDDGRITGLLDFEHAHVGDPMMDLAALRVRDTLKSLGDLAEIARATKP